MSVKLDVRWQKIASINGQDPIERSSHGASIIYDTLYVFGGENTARVPIDSSMYSINISPEELTKATPTWRKIEATDNDPIPRIAHAQAVIGDKIYIFGGRQGIQMDESPLNDLYYFDVKKETWTQVKVQGETPSPRSFHQMVSVSSSLFVFGGCGNDGRLSDLHEFDTVTETWKKHPNTYEAQESRNIETIAGRGGASLVVSNCQSKLFLLGGFAGKEMDDIYVYDLKLQCWKCLSDLKLPIPRSVCISTNINITGQGNCILIFGGEVEESNRGHEGAGGFSSDIVLINEDSLEINTITKGIRATMEWPIERGWSAGSSTNINQENIFAVFGGLSGNDDSPKRLNDLLICRFSTTN